MEKLLETFLDKGMMDMGGNDYDASWEMIK